MARDRNFVLLSAILFTASAAITVRWCGSMSGGMNMPGGWTMSMAWMKMPGQSFLAAAAAFVGMWAVMMVAMMLPSLVPELLRYRHWQLVGDRFTLDWLTTVAAAGYFLVWILIGTAVYPLGVACARTEMHSPTLARAVPFLSAMALLLAAGFQFTSWKSRSLCLCRGESLQNSLDSPSCRAAWSHGIHLGLNGALCCTGLMLALLVVGVMNVPAMAAITLGITFERLAPRP